MCTMDEKLQVVGLLDWVFFTGVSFYLLVYPCTDPERHLLRPFSTLFLFTFYM